MFRKLPVALLYLVVALASSLIAESKPNIVILYADDLGYGDLQCYNPESKIPTPNLDKLASEGMRFTDGHSSSGICTPSRYAMLTGRYHWRKFHDIVGAFGASVFDEDELTMPEMLKEQGYHTAVIGKWHLGWDWDAIRTNDKRGKEAISPDDFDWEKPIPDGPLAHGFDTYFGDTVINFPPYCWIENDRVTQAPDIMMDTNLWKPIKEGRWECRAGPMVTGWDPYENIPTTTAKGVELIHKLAKEDEPFFLYFAFPSPHAPIIPNDEFDGKSDAGPYGDFVFETDYACGQLLKALQEAGVADNTVVIFTADNGPEKYAYPRDVKYDHWSAEPLRGLKQDIYEGGHRVPFIVKWPGLTRPDSVSNALISQVDLMATFAAALGVKLPKDQAVDSFNMLPVLRGQESSVRTSAIQNTFEGKYVMRYKNWVLVDGDNGYHRDLAEAWEKKRNYKPDDEHPVELYDLKADLGQRHNVAQEHPETVSELLQMLYQIRKQGYSSPHVTQ